MPSAIDPTKPIDGVPAVKADLRANLAAAADEITALQGDIGAAVNIVDFGGVGDGTTDNTAAFDSAVTAAEATSDDRPVFFPPGIWRGDFAPKAARSVVGVRGQTVLIANTAGGYALDYDRPPGGSYYIPSGGILIRPFVRDIKIDGEAQSRNGLRIWNAIGVDLSNVFVNNAGIGIWQADNYYGLWSNVAANNGDIGLRSTWAPDDGRHFPSGHAGHKVLLGCSFGVNRVGCWFDTDMRRFVMLGGRIEGNQVGIVLDPDGGQGAHWVDAYAVYLDNVWFEGNAGTAGLTLSDAVVVDSGDVYVGAGCALHVTNSRMQVVEIQESGRLYAYGGDVGYTGSITLGGPNAVFKHALCYVPNGTFAAPENWLFDTGQWPGGWDITGDVADPNEPWKGRSYDITGDITNAPVRDGWHIRVRAVGADRTITPASGNCILPDGTSQATATVQQDTRAFLYGDGVDLQVDGPYVT